MTKITRQHLEYAALAAGLPDHDWTYANDSMICIDIDGDREGDPWRPHLDDGDAARLAVRLMMLTEVTGLVVKAYGPERCTNQRIAHDGTEPDKIRAWREAVVLCAAAVGERMKGGEG